jgi:hypothetical protein
MTGMGKIITTDKGVEVTEEMFEKWAEGFERGEWPGTKSVILGRPRLAQEEVKTVTFKLPISDIEALDQRVAIQGQTRSELLREAVSEYLAHTL